MERLGLACADFVAQTNKTSSSAKQKPEPRMLQTHDLEMPLSWDADHGDARGPCTELSGLY